MCSSPYDWVELLDSASYVEAIRSLSDSDKDKLFEEAERYGITRSQLIFREEAVTVREDISETEVIQSILEHSDKQVERLNATIAVLRDSISALNQQLNQLRPKALPTENSK